ncbi:MAG: hypothetical protein CMF38_05350 [Legionellaceae bacterium]|nr:hypothetical protein [Legionellaceae bacterium]HCA89266.1 hypothetical protein [Legionellales bacterium]|tara:strand:+ start:463 stop:2703 length:2241 start_codon:yes stop_codon:yes gene_type:complete
MPYQHVFLSLSAFIPDEVSEIAEISQEELDDGVKLKLKVDKIPSDAAIKRQLHRRDAMRLVLKQLHQQGRHIHIYTDHNNPFYVERVLKLIWPNFPQERFTIHAARFSQAIKTDFDRKVLSGESPYPIGQSFEDYQRRYRSNNEDNQAIYVDDDIRKYAMAAQGTVIEIQTAQKWQQLFRAAEDQLQALREQQANPLESAEESLQAPSLESLRGAQNHQDFQEKLAKFVQQAQAPNANITAIINNIRNLIEYTRVNNTLNAHTRQSSSHQHIETLAKIAYPCVKKYPQILSIMETLEAYRSQLGNTFTLFHQHRQEARRDAARALITHFGTNALLNPKHLPIIAQDKTLSTAYNAYKVSLLDKPKRVFFFDLQALLKVPLTEKHQKLSDKDLSALINNLPEWRLAFYRAKKQLAAGKNNKIHILAPSGQEALAQRIVHLVTGVTQSDFVDILNYDNETSKEDIIKRVREPYLTHHANPPVSTICIGDIDPSIENDTTLQVDADNRSIWGEEMNKLSKNISENFTQLRTNVLNQATGDLSENLTQNIDKKINEGTEYINNHLQDASAAQCMEYARTLLEQYHKISKDLNPKNVPEYLTSILKLAEINGKITQLQTLFSHKPQPDSNYSNTAVSSIGCYLYPGMGAHAASYIKLKACLFDYIQQNTPSHAQVNAIKTLCEVLEDKKDAYFLTEHLPVFEQAALKRVIKGFFNDTVVPGATHWSLATQVYPLLNPEIKLNDEDKHLIKP